MTRWIPALDGTQRATWQKWAVVTVHGSHAATHYADTLFVWVGLWLTFAVASQAIVGVAQWFVLGVQIGQPTQWLWASIRGAAIGGIAGRVLAYVIYALGGSDSNSAPLCLAAGSAGKIVTWTVTEAIIGLTLAQLVRTRPSTTPDRT
jgi:hypothetical protein